MHATGRRGTVEQPRLAFDTMAAQPTSSRSARSLSTTRLGETTALIQADGGATVKLHSGVFSLMRGRSTPPAFREAPDETTRSGDYA
jgi:hypothetical protein